MSYNTTFKLHKLSIQTNNKEIKLDTGTLKELKIYEDLMFPGILGEIVLIDFYDFSKTHEIMPGDKLIFQYYTTGEDLLSLKYTIYASKSNIMFEGGSSNLVTYSFCSDWLIDAFGTQYTKDFQKKKTDEIIKKILQEIGANVGDFQETKYKLENFVAPLWTPIQTIKYLISRTQSNNGDGSYFLYTNIKNEKVNFKSWNKIIEDGYKNYDSSKPYVIKSINPIYKNRMLQLTIEDNFDLIQFLNKGYYWQEIFNFDEDRHKIQKFDKNVKKYNYKHLSKYLPYDKKYKDEKYKTKTAIWLYPNKKYIENEYNYKQLIESYQNTLYGQLINSLIKINLLTIGSSDKRVGDIIKIIVPSIIKNKSEINETLTGEYLIRNILHQFTGNSYYQFITVVSDGYKTLKRSDRISW